MRLNLQKADSTAVCAAELIKTIQSGSFLIEGPDKNTIVKKVLEMAKGLFCSGVKENTGYCRVCNDCQMLAKGSHPDLYRLAVAGGSTVIKIEDIRLLKERVSVKPFQAQKKIFIIQDAERLNVAAANALLKTLEEPPAGVVLILITPSISQLLPTVVSRCGRIRFFQDASGSDADFEKRDQLIAGFFDKNDQEAQKKLYEDIGLIERNQAGDLLRELVCVFRDMLMIKLGVEAVNFMSGQSGQTLRCWSESFSAADIQMLIDDALGTKDYINGNANIKLAIDLLIKTINKSRSDLSLLLR
ncbi:MAG: hypothetical protein L6416_06215 [Candidatus Omnitrophica bacterium]|nr:hypothetical protein [Candidatus Omnitrophota bacterium]